MYIQKYVNGQTGLTAYIYRIIYYLQLKLWATLRNIKHISAEMRDYKRLKYKLEHYALLNHVWFWSVCITV